MFIVANTSALDVTCTYGTDTNWSQIDDVYFCDLKDSLDVTYSNATISAVNAEHLTEKSNADVVGFRAENKTLHYLPEGLGRCFEAKKIEFILIWSTGLREIHQKDLAPFITLRYLSLWDNDVEIIEKNLFQFNPEIKYLELAKNKIKFIDANVFQNLKDLSSLFLRGNPCNRMTYDAARGDKFKVKRFIKEIAETCKSTNLK